MLPVNDFVFRDLSHGLGRRLFCYLELALCFIFKKKSYFLILFHEGLVQFNLVSESCLTLCDAMDCSLLGASVHGILQTRILEWADMSFFRGSC